MVCERRLDGNLPVEYAISGREVSKGRIGNGLTWTRCAGRFYRDSVTWRCCRSSTRLPNFSRPEARPFPDMPRKIISPLLPGEPIARPACTLAMVSRYIRQTSPLKKATRSIISQKLFRNQLPRGYEEFSPLPCFSFNVLSRVRADRRLSADTCRGQSASICGKRSAGSVNVGFV